MKGDSAEKKEQMRGHRQRLRSRFLAKPSSLADYECLELFLTYLLARIDTKPLAKRLLAAADGSLYRLFNAPEQFQEAGLTENQRILFTLSQEVMRRTLAETLDNKNIMNTGSKVQDYLRTLFLGAKVEQFAVLYLKSDLSLLDTDILAVGTLNEVPVYPREVIKRALDCHAFGLIVAHNHPGTSPGPSSADLKLTRQLREGAKFFQLQLYDHIIIGNNAVYSFARDSDEILP